MAQLPEIEDKIADAIYATYRQDEAPRGHLGASAIGEECPRAVWYGFRWALRDAWSGRMLRLFQTGHLEEARVKADLAMAGLTVHDPSKEQDLTYYRFSDIDGHFGGTCDGVVENVPGAEATPHLLEVKTSNAKYFQELRKDGVRKAKPRHWFQMQTYMGYLKLERGLYVCVCKDDDSIYTERVSFDAAAFKLIKEKAKRIIDSSGPPARISDDPAWFQCKICPFYNICHQRRIPSANCRTCAMSVPSSDGQWYCNKWDDMIPEETQPEGCDSHIFLPDLIDAEIIDNGDEQRTFITYRSAGKEWVNAGPGEFPASDEAIPVPVFASKELENMAMSLVEDDFVRETKMMGGTVTAGERWSTE